MRKTRRSRCLPPYGVFDNFKHQLGEVVEVRLEELTVEFFLHGLAPRHY